MPDMTIEIGGRSVTVACQGGQVAFLPVLAGDGTRITQERMLLMAGLMLADKTISADEELRALDRRLAQQTQMIDEIQNRAAPEPVEVVREVEKEVIRETVPDSALERLDRLAEEAEALAAEAGELG